MDLDWSALFGLSLSPLELIVRGTAMYWFLFLLFRVVIRRRVGAVGISDVLLLVIIADASQNAMSGDYQSISDGIASLSVGAPGSAIVKATCEVPTADRGAWGLAAAGEGARVEVGPVTVARTR